MTKPVISLIAAVAANGVIGRNNDLPWRISEDLKYFKAITLGKPIVMGRKNYESIGRPLPGRRNIILTRDTQYSAEGCEVFHSPSEVLDACADSDDVMIIGGAEIYALFLDRAQILYLTEIKQDIPGDVFFPKIDWSQWQEQQRTPGQEDNEFDYEFVRYGRISEHHQL